MSRLAVLFLRGVVPVLAICLSLLGLETLRTNPLGWFLFLLGIVFAAGTVIVAYIRRDWFWESKGNEEVIQEETSDRSFWLITLGMAIIFYLSPLEYIYIDSFLLHSTWMKYCGLILIVLGCLIFALARRTLGGAYSGHVSVKHNQELVKKGIYSVIRHPAYLGYMLISLGIGVGYSSLIGLASILLVLVPVVVYRIGVEDRLLANIFGEQFNEYTRSVKRLLPGIW